MEFGEKMFRQRLAKRQTSLAKVEASIKELQEKLKATQASWQKKHEEDTAPFRSEIVAWQKKIEDDGRAKQTLLTKEQQPLLAELKKQEDYRLKLQGQIEDLTELLADEEEEQGEGKMTAGPPDPALLEE
jgi:uncharacterized coiled-coil protein SlyX